MTNIKSNKLIEIKDFYEVALKLLNENNKIDALKVLHEAMPATLYDKSLDILYNRNENASNNSLRSLITKVDKILNPTFIADEEGSDNPSVDEEWYFQEE